MKCSDCSAYGIWKDSLPEVSVFVGRVIFEMDEVVITSGMELLELT
jgi:hypothetical protein